jgi:Zn-dependent protease with chaperone function
MWAVLEPQERVALIGHELGHQVNGDIRRMRPVAMALRTLARWHELLRPTARSRVRGRVSNRWNPSGLIEWIILPLVLVPLTALTSAVGGLLVALSSRQGLMCEYRADQMAAQVGGTDAAVAMMEKLLVASTCMKFVTQKLRFESEIDPWAAVANYARGIPTREWERLRRVGLIRLPAVDTAHPPTQLRADLLAARTGMEARVYCDPARLAAIDEQLAPIVDQYTASVRSAIGR